MKKKGNKKMEKGVTTISRNPRKPAETYTHTHTHTSKSCLAIFEREFYRAIRIVERFESLFAFSSFNRFQQTLYIKGVIL